MTTYRKIYESYYGKIPRDKNDRTYEIHHIDGNHKNNNILNLKCVSIQEHYDTHYSQGDWGACFRISQRMNLDPTLKSELASKQQLKKVADGTHRLLGKNNPVHLKIANGTHHFLGPNNPSKLRRKHYQPKVKKKLKKKCLRQDLI